MPGCLGMGHSFLRMAYTGFLRLEILGNPGNWDMEWRRKKRSLTCSFPLTASVRRIKSLKNPQNPRVSQKDQMVRMDNVSPRPKPKKGHKVGETQTSIPLVPVLECCAIFLMG